LVLRSWRPSGVAKVTKVIDENEHGAQGAHFFDVSPLLLGGAAVRLRESSKMLSTLVFRLRPSAGSARCSSRARLTLSILLRISPARRRRPAAERAAFSGCVR